MQCSLPHTHTQWNIKMAHIAAHLIALKILQTGEWFDHLLSCVYEVKTDRFTKAWKILLLPGCLQRLFYPTGQRSAEDVLAGRKGGLWQTVASSWLWAMIQTPLYISGSRSRQQVSPRPTCLILFESVSSSRPQVFPRSPSFVLFLSFFFCGPSVGDATRCFPGLPLTSSLCHQVVPPYVSQVSISRPLYVTRSSYQVFPISPFFVLFVSPGHATRCFLCLPLSSSLFYQVTPPGVSYVSFSRPLFLNLQLTPPGVLYVSLSRLVCVHPRVTPPGVSHVSLRPSLCAHLQVTPPSVFQVSPLLLFSSLGLTLLSFLCLSPGHANRYIISYSSSSLELLILLQ